MLFCHVSILQYMYPLLNYLSISSYYLSISVVIPLLTEAALQNNNAPNRTQRRDIATVLLEAYRGLSGCCIHPHKYITSYNNVLLNIC